MARTKRGSSLKTKHKKVLQATKGFRGAPNRLANVAERAYINAGRSAYRDRRRKRRFFRQLWITRLNAATRQLGIRYSEFINLLNKSDLDMDRKQLSELAANDFAAFTQIVEYLKK